MRSCGTLTLERREQDEKTCKRIHDHGLGILSRAAVDRISLSTPHNLGKTSFWNDGPRTCEILSAIP